MLSREIAPTDSTSTSQDRAKMNSGTHSKRKLSVRLTTTAVATAVGRNWAMAPVRQSKAGQKRFWYRVPAVIAASAANAGHRASRPKLLPIFPDTTSATPAKPSTSPSHCRASTASFSTQPAPTAVSSG